MLLFLCRYANCDAIFHVQEMIVKMLLWIFNTFLCHKFWWFEFRVINIILESWIYYCCVHTNRNEIETKFHISELKIQNRTLVDDSMNLKKKNQQHTMYLNRFHSVRMMSNNTHWMGDLHCLAKYSLSQVAWPYTNYTT